MDILDRQADMESGEQNHASCDAVVESPPTDAEAARQAETERIRAELATRRISFEHRPPEPETVFALEIDEKPHAVAIEGEITAILAQAKAGKTALVGAVIGAALRGDAVGGDCFGFKAHNEKGKAVVHFDTEQSRFDVFRVVKSGAERAGVDEPPWLETYSLASMSVLDCRLALRVETEDAEERHGGIFAIILDGAADFIENVNDPDESNAFTRELMGLAETYRCPVFCILHENPAQETGKGRGHFGSELERKAGTVLRILKNPETEISEVFSAGRSRHCNIPKGNGMAFRYDVAAGMHISAGPAADLIRKQKISEERSKLYKVFGPKPEPLAYSNLMRRIEDAFGVKSRAARSRISKWVEIDILRKNDGGLYVENEEDEP